MVYVNYKKEDVQLQFRIIDIQMSTNPQFYHTIATL